MLEVTDIGVAAARLLRDGMRGRVAAVFERSFYVTDGHEFACIGVPGIGRGPLNACVADGTRWQAANVETGAPVSVTEQRIVIDGVPRFALHRSRSWAPSFAIPHDFPLPSGKGSGVGRTGKRDGAAQPPMRAAIDLATTRIAPEFSLHPALDARGIREQRLGQFLAAAGPRAPEMGLSRIVFAGDVTSTPVLRAAAGPVAEIRALLPQALRLGRAQRKPGSSKGSRDVGSTPGERAGLDPAYSSRHAIAHAAIELIGLGPGLTPSGDDFVGGLLIALRASGHGAVADALWNGIAHSLADRTSPLSAAHLRAAAEGHGAEAVHVALVDVLNRDTLDFSLHLAALDRIGHCSGWDAMAGVAVALTAGNALHR
jgi:Protein of unknown function (DUF2877)